MKWETIKTVPVNNAEGEVENIEIMKSNNYFKIQNEFGNVYFEFDSKSGIEFAEELFTIIYSSIFNDITEFLNNGSKNKNNNKQGNLFKNMSVKNRVV